MDDVIRRYIERALELSGQHEAALTEDDLAAIARDIGLGDADFALIDRAIEDSGVRGRGYAARQMWDDAVREFEEAAALAPTRVDVQLELARALMSRSGGDDRRRAETIARHTLKVDPGCEGAFELLAKLAPPKPSPSRGGPVLAMAALAGICTAGLLLYVAQREPDRGAAPPPPALVTVADPEPGELESVAVPVPDPSEPLELESGEVEVPVEWVGGEQTDLRFRARRSMMANYPQRSFYTLWGDIEVVGNVEIEQLDVRVQQLGADGAVLGTADRDGWASHEGRLRKGDHGMFTLLLDGHRAAKKVRVIPTMVKKVPAVGPYDAPRAIEPVWVANPPGHLKLEVREREASFSISELLKRGTFRATWEMANVGQVPIRKLAYVVKVYDKSGRILETRKKLATFSSNPPMEAGDVLIENTIAIFESTDYGRYEIEVVEIE